MLHVLFVVLIRALFFFNLLFVLKMSSSSLKRKKEIRRLLVSTRKDKRGRHLSRKVIHPLERFWRESRLRSHRADEKDVKRTKGKEVKCTKRRTKRLKRTQSTSLSPPGKRMSFELNGREKRTSLISFAQLARSKFSRHFPVSLYVIVCICSLTSGDGIAIAGSRNEFFVLRPIDVT